MVPGVGGGVDVVGVEGGVEVTDVGGDRTGRGEETGDKGQGVKRGEAVLVEEGGVAGGVWDIVFFPKIDGVREFLLFGTAALEMVRVL